MEEFSFWHRLLIGKAPFGFAFEVLLRTIGVYGCLLIAVRVLGRRMSGQVTNLELGVMLVLGAIVSTGMQAPDRGVVPALVLLGAIVLLQYGFSKLGAGVPRAERLLEGEATVLVKDGVILPHELERARVSQQQLLSNLRTQHVRSLGEVERVYLESDGAFSVLKREKPQPGLSAIPEAAGSAPSAASVCAYCGAAAPGGDSTNRECEVCQHRDWVPGVEP